ncbi:Hypothetical protein, putative [Bodo saltans]|uniref:Uncharacterized protein n=1 Tax=Bodo saltans TaxID=75058 RepID=A0A0S4KI11_BODSA|nr:Hypothetical protein, putative [Bodo saltans]|eukprot:CUI14152.1 Hypothetical protein, putative [Bodo saltans]
MFRVASSCGIPRAMWHTMHIMSQRQAMRVLPPLVPLSQGVSMTNIPDCSAQLAARALELLDDVAGVITYFEGIPFDFKVVVGPCTTTSCCMGKNRKGYDWRFS